MVGVVKLATHRSGSWAPLCRRWNEGDWQGRGRFIHRAPEPMLCETEASSVKIGVHRRKIVFYDLSGRDFNSDQARQVKTKLPLLP